VQVDLPTGATIVCTFGIVLAVMAAVRPLLLRRAIQNSRFKIQTVPVSESKG
jgi:hypothetical protein